VNTLAPESLVVKEGSDAPPRSCAAGYDCMRWRCDDPSPSVSAREARARSLAYAKAHPDDPTALKRAIYLELFLRHFDIEDQGEALPERLKHLDELRGLDLLSKAEYAKPCMARWPASDKKA
jgi:hypothetical protein